jgi:hypothetical protein
MGALMVTAWILGVGFVAGAAHVLAGPDHLAALAPLSLEARRRAWRVGLKWGLGHSVGVGAVAALALGLRAALPLEPVSEWGERLVGATLLVLGCWGFRRLFRRRLHAHAHRHGEREHFHFHVHDPGEDHEAAEAHVHAHAAFWVGALHGVAGASHLLGVLPGLALPGWGARAAYLGGFAGGTVGAMTFFAAAVGWAAPGGTVRGLRLYRWALGAASAACVGVGVAWLALSWRSGGP